MGQKRRGFPREMRQDNRRPVRFVPDEAGPTRHRVQPPRAYRVRGLFHKVGLELKPGQERSSVIIRHPPPSEHTVGQFVNAPFKVICTVVNAAVKSGAWIGDVRNVGIDDVGE